MACTSAQCCCCCLVCVRCLPATLYVKVQNLSFPTCGGGFVCGCNDTSWMNDQIAVFSTQVSSGIPALDWQYCVTFAAPSCGDATFCNVGAAGWPGNYAERLYQFDCSGVLREIHWGCVCVTPLPAFPTTAGADYQQSVRIICKPPDDDHPTAWLAVQYGITVAQNGVVDETCCWTNESLTYVDTGTGFTELSGFPTESPHGTWDTDGPVCDEDGNFVSQLWTFTTPEGVSGEILVYA